MFTPEMLKEWEEEKAKLDKEATKKKAFEYGEGGPKDKGAQGRYEERREKVAQPQLAFWWMMHNCVAHPLIGVLPFKPLFAFHDWTAKKIGSEVLMKSLF